MKLTLAICLSILSLTAVHVRAQSLTAVTASGKTVSYRVGKKFPWDGDVLKEVGPVYSESQRERHNQGTGLYQCTVNVKTGEVVSVAIKKSTGHQPLDEAAVIALKQWSLKPNSWREFEIPVSFVSNRDQQLYRDFLRRKQNGNLEQIPVRPGR